MKSIGITKFREQCLKLIARLTSEGLIIARQGKPVAMIVPYPTTGEHLIGSLKDRIRIQGEIVSTGEKWHPEDK